VDRTRGKQINKDKKKKEKNKVEWKRRDEKK
jgi:hypothetical protein